METTVTSILPRASPGDAEEAAGRVLALILVWSRLEPSRVGEVALLPRSADGRAYVLGRAGGRKDLPRVAWLRQRPGCNHETGPLTSPRVSRDQLLLQTLAGRRLALTNVGKLGLRIRGADACEGGLAAPGDLVELDGEALFMVTERAPTLPSAMSLGPLHPFGEPDADGVVGESAVAWALREQIAFVAGRAVHVLVRGESGTGKELVAQAIHRRSARGARPLCARNAATIPETLIDAELFGNARNFPQSGMPERPGLVGEADGSSLFLDEFAELPAAMQAHLLRVMDQGEYQRLGESRSRRADFRLIAATNRPEEALKHDVLARLQLRVELPGLNDRREDIPLLARALLRRIAARDSEMARRFFPGGDPAEHPALGLRLVASLLTRHYTTHVRELEALLWRAMTRSRGELVDAWEEHAVQWSVAREGPAQGIELTEPAKGASSGAGEAAVEPAAVDPMSIPPEVIQACLDRHGGRQEPAWRELGLSSRHVLTRLVKRHGLVVRGRR
ncbi:MAG: sigma-54-dependent Fis family transcriptional regulator [Myxococcales bacterium]|nr:sigma-54-dependent Fis family transcriptional regulator [Myxococcales bacterium]